MSSPGQTWAKVVEQSSAPTDNKNLLFARSECSVSLTKYLPTVKTPAPSGKFPVFFNLSSTQASHEEIAAALPPGILGVNWRADMNILEVDVQTEEEQSNLLSKPLQIPNHIALTPLPSTADSPRFVLVKLANVPITSAITLETILRHHWEQFGKVREIAPHRIPGKAWLTRRWDLIMEIDPKASTTPPTIFEVLETKVLAWWPRAPKTCLTCKIVGHNSSSCPRKKPKTAGMTNPPIPPTSSMANPSAAPE
ncbi:3108_t:CDS:1, partial [Paraglomus occultum]